MANPETARYRLTSLVILFGAIFGTIGIGFDIWLFHLIGVHFLPAEFMLPIYGMGIGVLIGLLIDAIQS